MNILDHKNVSWNAIRSLNAMLTEESQNNSQKSQNAFVASIKCAECYIQRVMTSLEITKKLSRGLMMRESREKSVLESRYTASTVRNIFVATNCSYEIVRAFQLTVMPKQPCMWVEERSRETQLTCAALSHFQLKYSHREACMFSVYIHQSNQAHQETNSLCGYYRRKVYKWRYFQWPF